METKDRQVVPLWLALPIVFGLLGAWGVSIFFFDSPPNPKPGSVIDLRGNNIVLLRVPSAPVQEIAVYEDGLAIRFTYPVGTPERRINLTTDEQREIAVLLAEWCQHFPDIPSLAPGESFYDLGIRCGGWPATRVRQTKLPFDALPPIFIQLLKRLPPVAPTSP